MLQFLKSENGVLVEWESLTKLSNKFFQMYGIIILGCRDEKLLRRYEDDQKMYETCDIVIELIDCAFWEVFSKDESFINRLTLKFKEIEFLESDFQDAYKEK